MFAGKSKCGVRGDVILQIDWEVEQIVKALEKQKIADNTIVIFTSDNGPILFDGYFDNSNRDLNGHEPTAKLRGWKYLIYEGGTRVPFVVQWPKVIPHGVVSQQILSLTDIIATLANITGQTIPNGEAPDSLDMASVFTGKSTEGPRRSIVLQGVSNAYALRDRKWKFVKANVSNEASGIGQRADPNDMRFAEAIVREEALYDLESDPFEKNNLAKKMPTKVAEMRAELDQLRK
jgi:arylsulfatase A-like enzyme